MAETNQLLLNYYKKEEIKKIKKLSKEKASLKTILSKVDLNFITKEEVLEILGEDYEQEITTGFAVKYYDEDGSNSEMTFYPCKVDFTNWEANEDEVLAEIKRDFPPSEYQNNEW